MTSVIFPSNWEKVELSDVALFQNGYAFKSSAYSDVGDFVIRIGNVQDKGINLNNPAYVNAKKLNAEKFRLSKGDILISLTGNVGRVAIIKEEHLPAVLNQRVAKVNFSSSMPSKFNYYLLRSNVVQSELLKCAKGAAQLNISTKDMDRLMVGIPSVAEQKIIAEKLDTLLAQVDSTKARLEKIPKFLKRFRQAVLAAAVNGKLTEEWRNEKKIPFKSWEIKKANDLCIKVQSGSTPTGNPFAQNGTIPFLKVYNIVNQKIDFNYKPQYITDEVHRARSKRSIAIPDDVLMNIVGPPLGKVAILTEQYPEWNINQAIALFRVDKEKLLSGFLYLILCEGSLVRDVMHETKGIVGQINISLTQCREALIPCPSLEEQQEIVRRVEQLFAYADTIEKQVNSALSRVNNLTQLILEKAFRGELTAQWRAENPELISGENSAAALLEKIKAERAVSTGKKGSRKKS